MLLLMLLAAAAPQQPVEPWRLTQLPEGCRLSATLDTGLATAIGLQPQLTQPGTILRLVLARPVRVENGDAGEIVLRPSGNRIKAVVSPIISLKASYETLIPLVVDAPFFRSLETTEVIEVRLRSRVIATIRLVDAPAQIERLNACGNRVLMAWGVDPEVQAAVAKPAELLDNREHGSDAEPIPSPPLSRIRPVGFAPATRSTRPAR